MAPAHNAAGATIIASKVSRLMRSDLCDYQPPNASKPKQNSHGKLKSKKRLAQSPFHQLKKLRGTGFWDDKSSLVRKLIRVVRVKT